MVNYITCECHLSYRKKPHECRVGNPALHGSIPHIFLAGRVEVPTGEMPPWKGYQDTWGGGGGAFQCTQLRVDQAARTWAVSCEEGRGGGCWLQATWLPQPLPGLPLGPLVALPPSWSSFLHRWVVGWLQQVQPTRPDVWYPEEETGISY